MLSSSTLSLGSTKETPALSSLEWSGLGSFWKDMGLLGIWGQAWDPPGKWPDVVIGDHRAVTA